MPVADTPVLRGQAVCCGETSCPGPRPYMSQCDKAGSAFGAVREAVTSVLDRQERGVGSRGGVWVALTRALSARGGEVRFILTFPRLVNVTMSHAACFSAVHLFLRADHGGSPRRSYLRAAVCYGIAVKHFEHSHIGLQTLLSITGKYLAERVGVEMAAGFEVYSVADAAECELELLCSLSYRVHEQLPLWQWAGFWVHLQHCLTERSGRQDLQLGGPHDGGWAYEGRRWGYGPPADNPSVPSVPQILALPVRHVLQTYPNLASDPTAVAALTLNWDKPRERETVTSIVQEHRSKGTFGKVDAEYHPVATIREAAANTLRKMLKAPDRLLTLLQEHGSADVSALGAVIAASGAAEQCPQAAATALSVAAAVLRMAPVRLKKAAEAVSAALAHHQLAQAALCMNASTSPQREYDMTCLWDASGPVRRRALLRRADGNRRTLTAEEFERMCVRKRRSSATNSVGTKRSGVSTNGTPESKRSRKSESVTERKSTHASFRKHCSSSPRALPLDF
eukprot:TRINITY_DN5266_c0_g3_i10.p1 TRINITY_DN5266_c0_g3~~TRINITY_DN5266_c0_g3_i10.p1  ORF type:complete len:510 (+),score=95.98 TRINITY_DN5266_c0_g3_i10:313-1842(+)